jgi:hypothetical protein
MEVKEKAKELVDKMLFCYQGHIDKYTAKQCALIAAGAVIEQNNIWIKQTGRGTNNYWKEVKQEIEKL